MLLNPSSLEPDSGATSDLAAKLAAFDQPVANLQATNLLKANTAPNDISVGELEQEAEEDSLALEEPTEEAPTEEETNPDESAFAVEFEQEFGMKPGEAIELVQELQGFRQELQLMREWQVSPVEYDNRIAQVKEFYNGLPEGDREKFNSAEGAKVIWNHISKQNTQETGKRQPRTRNSVRTQAKQPNVPQLLTKSDILAMDDATYQRELPNITRAYREGRVVD